jgi:predicted amidophosphoribosyltransferase
MAVASGNGGGSCPKCGTIPNPGARFCKRCGAKFQNNPSTTLLASRPRTDTGQDIDKRKTNEEISRLRAEESKYRKLVNRGKSEHLPDLAKVLGCLGTVLYDQNDLEEAISKYRECEAIRRKLVDGGMRQFLPDLGKALNNLGTALARHGELDGAIAVYRECEKIRRELVGREGGKFLPDLAYVLNGLGAALLNQDKVREAIAKYQECERIYGNLVNRGLVQYRSDLGRVHDSIAVACSRQADEEATTKPARPQVGAAPSSSGQKPLPEPVTVSPSPPTPQPVAPTTPAPPPAAGGFCPYCGRRASPGTNFCRACGKSLEPLEQASPSVSQTAGPGTPIPPIGQQGGWPVSQAPGFPAAMGASRSSVAGFLNRSEASVTIARPLTPDELQRLKNFARGGGEGLPPLLGMAFGIVAALLATILLLYPQVGSSTTYLAQMMVWSIASVIFSFTYRRSINTIKNSVKAGMVFQNVGPARSPFRKPERGVSAIGGVEFDVFADRVLKAIGASPIRDGQIGSVRYLLGKKPWLFPKNLRRAYVLELNGTPLRSITVGTVSNPIG